MEMAAFSATAAAAEATKAKELKGSNAFNMRSLSVHLPFKRKGLSKNYSGKCRSFACLADANCVEDLEKAELPEAKRRKYSDRRTTKEMLSTPPPCRNGSSGASSYVRPCVGA